MKHHFKQKEVETLIEHKLSVLLEGPKGSGKSTILMKAAENLDLDYVSITGTRQTTVGSLLGFISVTGTYIPSLLRDAVENGKMFVLEEIDGMDPNTLLCLNSIENGYLSFPDGLIDVHENFRLCATANPSDEHAAYTGRSRLDAASLDRFDVVRVDTDKELEIYLTDEDTYNQVSIMRDILSYNNEAFTVSMRDAIRFHKRKAIGLADNYESILLKHDHLVSEYKNKRGSQKAKAKKESLNQEDCRNTEELWNVVWREAKMPGKPKSSRSEHREEAEFWGKKAVEGKMHEIPNYVEVLSQGPSAEDPLGLCIIIKLKGEIHKLFKDELL